MNKQELINHLKLSSANVDEILTVAELPIDSPDYLAEQVKITEEIAKLVESKQAKTFKEAAAQIKPTKSKKAAPHPPSAQATAAMAKTNGAAADLGIAPLDESFPDQEVLRATALHEAHQDQTGLARTATESIFEASDQLQERARDYGRALYFDALRDVMADPATIERTKEVIEEVRRRRRPNRST